MHLSSKEAAKRKVFARPFEWSGGSRLHILHVTQSTGGVAKYLRSLASDQVNRGWRVTVVCPLQGPFPDFSEQLPGVAFLPWNATRNPGPSVLGEVATLRRLTQSVSPDLIHLHSSKAGLVGRLAAVGYPGPVIFQPHAWSFEAVTGLMKRLSVGWERVGARLCEQLVCVSEAERERAVQAGLNAAMTVILSGVEIDGLRAATFADRRRARRTLRLAEGPLAVCVGRLCKQKGQDVLLEAWRTVAREVPDAKLALVGDGDLAPMLRYMQVPNVIFAGVRHDVPAWLTAADLLAAPSRWEGFSLAILEAMALGRTVVAADVDGVREALGENVGEVVAQDDPSALVTPIVERLLDARLAAREGRLAAKRAEDFFDIRRTHEEIAALYSRLLNAKLTERGVRERRVVPGLETQPSAE
jgi:glycosyltransferase involved in cell wall biosynthesis